MTVKMNNFLWFLAARNVRRYWKRSLQSFLILFCGALCVMVVDSFLRGFAQSASVQIVNESGHLDVHAPGYLESAEATPLDLAVPDVQETARWLISAASQKAAPGTRVVAASSILTGCMIANGETSRGALVWGVDVEALGEGKKVLNPALTDLPTKVTSGRFFQGPEDRGLLLDAKVASRLGTSPGSSVILVGTDAFGSFAMVEVPVLGIVASGALPGGAGALADRQSLGSGLGMENSATAVSLWFLDANTMAVLGSKAEPQAAEAAVAAARAQGLQARPFAEISAGSVAMFEFLDLFLGGMMAVFAVVAGVGTANAILLSVQDRVKDLGTLRAIALSSRQAGRLIYCETLLVGIAAATAALTVGTLLVWTLETTGMAITFDLSKISFGLPDDLRPAFFPDRIALLALVSAIFPLVAAILPARAASKLTVRECFAGGG